MDQTITADSVPSTHEAVTSRVIADLHAIGRTSVHAEELARALAIVSQCYSVPVPSSATSAIPKALLDVSDLLQRHRLYENDTVLCDYPTEQCPVLESGLRLLWTHVTTYQLHAALIDLVRTIDYMPRAITFWKHLETRTWREVVQRGPLQWCVSRMQRISIQETIRSLHETLEAHLVQYLLVTHAIVGSQYAKPRPACASIACRKRLACSRS